MSPELTNVKRNQFKSFLWRNALHWSGNPPISYLIRHNLLRRYLLLNFTSWNSQLFQSTHRCCFSCLICHFPWFWYFFFPGLFISILVLQLPLCVWLTAISNCFQFRKPHEVLTENFYALNWFGKIPFNQFWGGNIQSWVILNWLKLLQQQVTGFSFYYILILI